MSSNLKKLRKELKRRLGLRTERPCFTGQYYERARRLLLDAIDIFNEAGLPYTLDAGTLLGLVREGDLIPWDNDLDMMLPAPSLPQLRQLFWKFRRRGWGVSRTYTMDFASEAWQVGDPRVVKIRRRHLLLFGAGSTLLDITIIRKHGDYYWWEMAKRTCRIQASYFDSHDFIDFAGRRVRVPHDYEHYLEHTYGDWRTPRQDFPHGEFGVIVPPPGSREG
jgi:hypothetical protein